MSKAFPRWATQAFNNSGLCAQVLWWGAEGMSVLGDRYVSLASLRNQDNFLFTSLFKDHVHLLIPAASQDLIEMTHL